MVMLVLEDLKSKIIGVQHVHSTIEPEETVRVDGPTGVRGLGVGHIDGSQRVRVKSGENVIVEVLHIEQGASPKYWSCKVCCPEGCSELLLHKHWLEVVRIDMSVVLIPLLG